VPKLRSAGEGTSYRTIVIASGRADINEAFVVAFRRNRL